MGQVWIGVLPDSNSNLIGLSKYARITNWVMGRPQIQEEAIVQLADLLNDKMKPQGLAIVMKADHFCMQWRGVKDMNSKMINSVMRGAFLKNSDLRKEFLDLLPLNKNWISTVVSYSDRGNGKVVSGYLWLLRRLFANIFLSTSNNNGR